MESLARKPFQGVINIVRFNRHFFLAALLLIMTLAAAGIVSDNYPVLFFTGAILLFLGISVSLAVSCYVYDLSGLYTLDWLPDDIGEGLSLNIHAGFDETSGLLAQKYPGMKLLVLDFYDPEKHTEISIKRARKAYPAFPGTQTITTTSIPAGTGEVNTAFLILAAHEIRKTEELVAFFNELRKVLKINGTIIVAEHLRDLPNFLAYTVGFFHFFSRKHWIDVFKTSRLDINREYKVTPFIRIFILKKHGATP